MTTVKDVARAAEVSVGTVSKVLSKDQTVKPALRARVLQAVETLGYKPNLAARALRTNRVSMFGLIVPDITNPFFAQLAKNIEAEAGQVAHTVMLANSDDDPEKEAQQVETLLNQSPRGLIVVGASRAALRGIKTQVPIVSVDRRYGSYRLISTDHQKASAMVADHFFGLGHRRIAYISGPQSTEVGRLRKKGFCDRISELATTGDPVSLVTREGQFNYLSGEENAYDLIGQAPDVRPTAIAAASDQQAIGALRAARDVGLAVPGDLSIAGFDDITLAGLVVPRLTTVAQPSGQIAKAAVHALLEEAADGGRDQVIAAQLEVRGSSGPAP
ncbi:LacI family DNA-binding transcriptional regulator [Litoreibacter roseus]|uniref:LacI family transcriptional regulator n=1 Tax=Litoreibacter roseus TaxID=2601869 RepID=A0A6N6JMQ0_9RHOB|nr:LacI family DNA-binding transcriptional regulator [Litoreibacter roseus]GFE66482.1 LacI family transcriptional regulator [Litoreibacter roseus]